MIVLSMLMISGVYICSVFLKQKGLSINPNSMKIDAVEIPCTRSNIPQSEVPYVHYPEPTTYKR